MIARSGSPWRDLPKRYGAWQTVYSRFRKWIEDGILDNIFRVLSLEAELKELSIDASIVQAHQHSDWWLYKERHLVENYFLKLKAFRRIATRYDKLAATFLGFLCIVSILIWLK